MYNLTEALSGFLEKTCDRCSMVGENTLLVGGRCRQCWKLYYENGEDKL